MAILIARTAVVPIWLLACVLIVVSTAPSGLAMTALLLLSSGLAAAAIHLAAKNGAHPSFSDGTVTIDARPLSVTAVPRLLRRQPTSHPPEQRPEPPADRRL